MSNSLIKDSLQKKLKELDDQTIILNRMTKMFEKSFDIVDKPSKEYYVAISLMNDIDYTIYEMRELIGKLK